LLRDLCDDLLGDLCDDLLGDLCDDLLGDLCDDLLGDLCDDLGSNCLGDLDRAFDLEDGGDCKLLDRIFGGIYFSFRVFYLSCFFSRKKNVSKKVRRAPPRPHSHVAVAGRV
jgi:hypothetical protein